jgi:SnoaL-like protein
VPPTVLAFLHHPDPDRLDAMLAADVQFHSPVADYLGHADVRHLFTAIAEVLDSVEAVRDLSAASEHTTFISGSVDGHAIEGVLDEHFDEAGRIVEVTLMLRPLSALNRAVSAMASALKASPLPSSAR